MNNINRKRKKFGISEVITFAIVAFIVIAIIMVVVKNSNPYEEISRNTLISHIENGNVASIKFSGKPGDGNQNILYVEGIYSSRYTNANSSSSIKGFTYTGDRLDKEIIESAIALYNVNNPTLPIVIDGNIKISTFDWFGLINILILIVVGVFIIMVMFRNVSSSNNRAFDFGKNRAQMTRKVGVTFKDVAGLEEEKEEMIEIVDFLKNPQKYFSMGARIPKGILLVGDPGTGKTLLARAVSGEANVPFFTISGSDFVEMFVGVGASRVRDMFKTAKQHAPCIVFIDEIDAVGRQRGTGLGGGHDEREQTLNQLLVEMDGFATNTGVIVMAATNRSDVLDPALLRPGRFDRQITISLPNLEGREAILKVHARNKKLSKRINFLEVAKRTPYFSGADLENLLNEAALLAARENASEIKIYHIDEAIDRVMMGPAKRSHKYSEKEKASTAYHEAGHAVIGLKLTHATIVQKVTIVPRGKSGGYNLMTPKEETYFATKEMLMAQIVSLLAGRIAEEIVFNELSTGCYNDFERATRIARAMVTEYGMSNLGPIQYENNKGNVFLGRDYSAGKNFSDQVALEIDQEVRRIIDECYQIGTDTINEHRKLLDLIAKTLVEIETLTREDIDELMLTGQLAWWEKKKAKMLEDTGEIITPTRPIDPADLD